MEIPHALVPYYHLDRKNIILLDSGCMLQGELEAWLRQQGLCVRAVLNTHDHWDHTAANGGLQQEGALIYMPKIEAALHASDLSHMIAYNGSNYQLMRHFYAQNPFRVDEAVPEQDGPFRVFDAEFQVVHTPGHTVDHVSYITPDNVLYVGDTLMSVQLLRTAKINYALCHEIDLESKEKLRQYRCAAYVLAHGSVEQELGDLIDWNIAFVKQRSDQLWRLVEKPMTMEEIIRAAWKAFALRGGSYIKNLEVSNMIRWMVQYLVSIKRLELRFYDGVDYYAHSKQQEEKK